VPYGRPSSEVGYTSSTTGRGDHELHKGYAVALGEKNMKQVKKLGNKYMSKIELTLLRIIDVTEHKVDYE
jgi:hypothetical protein